MWPLAVLTVFYKEMYDRFAGSKRSGRNNGGTVLPR